MTTLHQLTGPVDLFIQEPPVPSTIQWPPFVPTAPRHIDAVLVPNICVQFNFIC